MSLTAYFPASFMRGDKPQASRCKPGLKRTACSLRLCTGHTVVVYFTARFFDSPIYFCNLPNLFGLSRPQPIVLCTQNSIAELSMIFIRQQKVKPIYATDHFCKKRNKKI